jgi:diguanylate cyclase (GGDEF)-like protein/PAS domain S-box-containing protein
VLQAPGGSHENCRTFHNETGNGRCASLAQEAPEGGRIVKRKIILSLLAVLLSSVLGASITTIYIRNTTATLARLINLHQIESLRQHLVISIQTVQSDLYTVHTTLGHKLDRIVDNVTNLDQAARKCSTCHHTPGITRQIEQVQKLISGYKDSLSYYITAPSNSPRANKLKLDAAAIGNELLVRTEDMSVRAGSKLEAMTQDAMRKIRQAWYILAGTMLLTLLLGVVIAVHLTNSITGPINTLVNATRMIAAGDLGYSIAYRDKTEFGELASHFNIMSASLKDGYTKLEEEIHERKRTGAALAESEAFLNTIFDSIRDPFCIIDRGYRIVRANEAYARMKNRKLDVLIGSTCYEALLEKSGICRDCIVEKTFASGDPCAKEKEDVSADGTRTWRAIYTYPIEDPDGKISHVIEYSQDITERKKAEENLRESEERYALAARGANDGLWDWDLRNNKVYFSIRWKSMLGYTEKEISNHPEEWFSRVHPDDRDEMETRIAAHLNGRNPHFEDEYRVMHKDGTYRWVINRGLAVRSRDGLAYRMAGSQTDITSRKHAEKQLVYDAFHDALTGLPNRALFMDRLQHVIATSRRRADTPYAVLFLDMDRFKTVNDSLGHTIGDHLLIAVGRMLADCLRPGDTVARLGGDEFAVLLENINELADAIDVAGRINKKLGVPAMVKGHEIFSSVSIGIALGSERYERPEQVLRDADIAMYQAKGRGCSCYEVFDTKMHANILDRLQLEADLRGAVDHRELVLFYQPIIDLKTQKLTGFEALVRWNHPKRGLLFPMDFIPLSEENGLIAPIGEWIFHEACSELKVLQQRFPAEPPLKMSINISSKQFTQQDLVAKLGASIKETGVDARSLALEITESMIMENVDAAVDTMKRLRDMGIQIHLDDFGTGYSSLSYLHRFPINALKIDRTFISKLTADGGNREVILSIISLANSMNFDVIAEGVELEHQLVKIKELHCGFGQGFLFAHPMDLHDTDLWLKEQKNQA